VQVVRRPNGISLAVAIATGLIAPACEPPPESAVGVHDASAPDSGGPDASGPAEYSIVVLPDTQYYSSSWPDIFTAQTRWIVENREARRIAFVLHTGDIVDADTPGQWNPAVQALQLLDGEVPYAVTAGNHDYLNLADRMGMINTYFPPAHFAQYPWFGGTYEPGHLENSFSTFTAGSGKWLVLALEFGPRDEVLAWADSVLKLFRDTPAIIITHAYLYRDGSRYDASGSPSQQFNPHAYVMMGQGRSTINDGEEMWQKLIAVNSNVKLVFSGHDVSGNSLPPGTASRLTSVRADGTSVHQMLANYQTCTGAPCATYGADIVHGGNGFLRILRFSATDGISVSTYSPYLDEALHDPANEFVLPLN
jgi:hypothetical protein